MSDLCFLLDEHIPSLVIGQIAEQSSADEIQSVTTPALSASPAALRRLLQPRNSNTFVHSTYKSVMKVWNYCALRHVRASPTLVLVSLCSDHVDDE